MKNPRLRKDGEYFFYKPYKLIRVHAGIRQAETLLHKAQRFRQPIPNWKLLK